ncbi:MAG: TerC/Alx family metal homeostasis membrane protein [Rhodospirillales bacterium]|nr:TerC/Alx family metal homeostasis membrane protein [Rhodospirillales bacterium]
MEIILTNWAFFFVLVPLLLYVDLHFFNKNEDRIIGFKHSLILSSWYIAAGLAFGLLIWLEFGQDKALNYYTAYILEKSLSLDNLFVMSVIFSACCIPREYQHRVLIWGIIGVIILRGLMIGLGAAAVRHYTWVLYIFALILIYTGFKLIFMDEEEESDPEEFAKKPLVVFLKKHLPFTPKIYHNHFFAREEREINGAIKTALVATPLFLALVVIEISDVMFAFDSVPAALAITTETFIVYTSNIFAILGLRALYFAVENILNRFGEVKYALSAVLIFIGGKVFYNAYFQDITAITSLFVTLSVLAVGFTFSWVKTRLEDQSKESQE